MKILRLFFSMTLTVTAALASTTPTIQSAEGGLITPHLPATMMPEKSAITLQNTPPSKRIAITFDDLPFVNEELSLNETQNKTQALLKALKKHHVKAIGFVNEDKLYIKREIDARIGLLEAWLDAGIELGNHNFGHLGFQNTPLATYEEAVLKGETVTRWLLQTRGQVPRYYRHPYTQTGPTPEDKAAFEAFLTQHGYTVAPVTVEHDDFIFASVYRDAQRHGDYARAKRVQAAYLTNLERALDTFEIMSQELFNRQIAQVLLLHANCLNADSLNALFIRMKQRGYRFIPLDEALSDNAYTLTDGYIGKFGPSWLRRWADGLGKTLSIRGQPDPEAWIMKSYKALQNQ